MCAENEEQEKQSNNDAAFSYKEVSELSDATEDLQIESVDGDNLPDLDDYELLVQGTRQKMQILKDDESQTS